MAILSKFVSYKGLEQFWKRITQRYDKKLDSVTNTDDSIQVNSGREISARVSSTQDNLLSVEKGKGLYVKMPVLHKLTFGADKEYTYDGTEDVTVPVYNGEYKD
jgi:hypothetical protein